MKYQFIEQHKQEFPVVVMCRVLEVSESGFYAWRKRPTCQRKREDAQLTEEIRQEFHAHQGRYGSPRLHAELRDRGRSIARKRVARLMREAGLYGKRKRRRALTTRRDPSHPVAPTTLNREFTATEPNSKWVTDLTYIPTIQGWLYLAVILDLYSRMVVGWSMSGNCDENLVERALNQAIARRRPKAGLLHHSDRGSQYTSQAYQACLKQAGISVSMSRKGNCWDNAAMESFFGTVKDECVGSTIYASHDEARLELFTYMEVYYNRVRRHSTLGYVSPLNQELAQAVGFISIRTIDRWISGTSNPQKQETIRKLGLVNEDLNEALKREFPEAFQMSKPLGGQIGRVELPAEFYRRVIHAYVHVPFASRRWTIWHLVSNQMLPHLDPERTGLLVIYTRLSNSAPARLLCEEGAGNTLWTTRQVQTPADAQSAYDAEPWLVQAVAAGRPFFLQSCISAPSYLLHHELVHSLGFFPICRSGGTAGGLLLCARQEDFFTPLRQSLIEEYACLFALALSESDFAQTPP